MAGADRPFSLCAPQAITPHNTLEVLASRPGGRIAAQADAPGGGGENEGCRGNQGDEWRVDPKFGTAEEARRAGARVVSHDRNRGYGAALRSGFGAAAQPWIFQMDCDNQFDPEELEKLVALAGGAEIVIGHRSDRADEPRRIWAGRAWNWLVRFVFGSMARDIDCGFKLLDRAAISRLDLGANGACISVELCVAGRQAGLRIAEVDVGHRPRVAGAPTGLRPRVVARGLLELYGLRRRYGGRPRQ